MKLFVSAGNPDHESCGEMSSPPGTPNNLDHWAIGSGWPPATVSLESWNDGTAGRYAYGFVAADVVACAWLMTNTSSVLLGWWRSAVPMSLMEWT
jgi:hypothetical protein